MNHNIMVATIVSRVVKEISHQALKSRRAREGCPLFYQLIEDGDAKAVDNVMQRLEPKARKWILGLQHSKRKHAECVRLERRGHVITRIITAIMFVILTPVFYVIHGLIASFHRHWQLRFSRRKYPVPLFSAVLSGHLDVMAVLLMHGSDYTQTDAALNNVLHYLGLISGDDPVAALRGYKSLRKVLVEGDSKTIMQDLLHGKNKEGLCPAEHCSLYGALKLCTELINDMNKLDLLMTEQKKHGNIKASASETQRSPESATLCTAGLNLEKQMAAANETATTRITVDDPSPLRDQTNAESTVLHFLSNRDVLEFNTLDTESARKCRSLSLLTGRTVRWLWSWSALYHLLQTMFTVVVIWAMIDSGRSNDPYPFLIKYSRLYVETMPDFIDENTTEWLHQMHNCTDYILAGKHSCNWEFLKAWLRPQLPDMRTICIRHGGSEGFNITDEDIYKASGAVLLQEETTIGTVMKEIIFFDLVGVLCLVLTLANLLLDIVYRLHHVLRQGSVNAVWLYRLPGSYTERQLSIFMYTSFTGFFVYSIYYAQQINQLIDCMKENLPRLIVVVRLYSETHFDDAPTESPLPTHNFSMHNDRDIYYVKQDWVPKHTKVIDATESAVATYVDTSSYLLVLCLVLRCIITVYSMRLLPGIGLFVITTKRMIQHLAEFYCVFFVIQLAVASTFHFLMRSRPCLPHIMEGYETFQDALYSTFMLAANPGSFQLRRENVSAEVFVVVFLIMMAIFLLNMITAVMTAAVMALAHPGRRRFLCEQECWKELISVRAMSRILHTPKQ